MRKLNYYDVEEVTICPYCGSEPYNGDYGCCGESSAHFETSYKDSQGEIYSLDEVELYRPILDVIRYELNFQALKRKFKRFKRITRDRLTKVYDDQDSYCRKLRQITGFQWSRLDRLILEQLHDFPLYTKSAKQWAIIRKQSVKAMRDSWAKGELLGCNLFPKISENE